MKTAPLFDLSGEVAVVLGGTGGLGGAMAEGLAQAGAKVAVLGRNKERGEAKAKEISKVGKGIFLSVDALDSKGLAEADKKIEKELGAVTVLVKIGRAHV